jgi:transposase
MTNNCNSQLENWKALVGDSTTLVIGIDVSRLKHDACFGTRDKVYRSKFYFDNDIHGFKSLLEMMDKIYVEGEFKDILLGVEPTSYYWYPLAEFLKSKGYAVCLLDPVSVYHNRKTIKKDSGKSDKKDAYAIFDLINQKKFFFTVNTTKEGFAAKIALKNWMCTQNALIRIKNRMRAFLSLSFPELESMTEEVSALKFLAFLKKYPTPAHIVKLPEETFVSDRVKKLKLYKAGELKEIYYLAQKTVGVPLRLEMGELTMQKLIEDMEFQLAHEKKWFQYCNEIAKLDPGYERVNSIKGIGPKITTGLILALGDYRSISNSTQITKLAGLNLVDKTSGSSINKPSQISHQGNKELRFWGYHAALQLIKTKGPFKTLYKRKVKNSPGKGSGKRALMAVSDKINKVAWAILTKGENYQEDYDKKVKKNYTRK